MNKNILIIIIYSILIATIITLTYSYYETKDSKAYLRASEIISGGDFSNIEKETPSVKSRILRPLQTLIISIYPPFREHIFYYSNVIFILLTSLLVYYITIELKLSKKIALFSALSYNSSVVLLNFGYALMAEAATYFFYALTIYLILKYYNNFYNSYSYPLIISLVCGIATLIKENAGIGIVFLCLLILFNKKIKRARLLISTTIIFFIPFMIAQLIIANLIGYSYIDWIQHIRNVYGLSRFTLWRFFLTYGIAFNVLLPFFIYYFYKNLNKINLSLLLSGILTPFILTQFYDRYVFLAFPLIIPFGLAGFELKFPKRLPIFVLIYMMLNFILFVLYRYPLTYNIGLKILNL